MVETIVADCHIDHILRQTNHSYRRRGANNIMGALMRLINSLLSVVKPRGHSNDVGFGRDPSPVVDSDDFFASICVINLGGHVSC